MVKGCGVDVNAWEEEHCEIIDTTNTQKGIRSVELNIQDTILVVPGNKMSGLRLALQVLLM